MNKLILIISFFSLISCSYKKTSISNKPSGDGIINGEVVQAQDPINASIVSVYDVKYQALCTGSLIAPNIVMTAAHCMEGKSSNYRIVFGQNFDEWLNSREPDVVVDHIRFVTDFVVHEEYSDGSDPQRRYNTHDIALVKFRGTIPEGYKPATFLNGEVELGKGVMVTVAGYGVSKVEVTPIDATRMNKQKLMEGVNNGQFDCDDSYQNCSEVKMTGDGILQKTQAPILSMLETEVVLDEKHAGTCSGDSGGPAYILKDGNFYLFGITSRGSGLCDGYGIYTNASITEYQKWITENSSKLK